MYTSLQGLLGAAYSFLYIFVNLLAQPFFKFHVADLCSASTFHSFMIIGKTYSIVPVGCSTGLFSMTSGEEQVSGKDTGAGCSAKIASV